MTDAAITPTERLRELLELHGDALETVDWPSEGDRWVELLVCLCHQRTPALPMRALRSALHMLEDLNLVSVEALRGLASGSAEHVVVTQVLQRHGLGATDAAALADLMSRLARATEATCGGRIQKVLRAHALAARDELAASFAGIGLGKEELEFALTHWLQNATSAPISLQSRDVVAFCRALGITLETLEDAADELGLNLALLDDVLAMDAGQRSGDGP